VLKTILKREIQHNLYSLRFMISLVLVLGVFIVGSLSFVRNHQAALEKDRVARTEFVDKMKADAALNATVLAVTKRNYPLRPRDNGFISDAKEKYLPNEIVFSAWNVFSFHSRSGTVNPFLTKHDELNWSFIIGLIVSFVTLLFTFDAVSGEKESKTLALALANSVSRGTLLFGKYLSAIVSILFVVVPGVLLSLLIILVFGRAQFTPTLAAETAGFLLAVVLMSASFAAFGLLSSVLARNANISLLMALSFWLLFVVVIPNSSAFVAKRFYPIESSEAVLTKVDAALDDLSRNAPRGSWAMQSQNPFMPLHELRANLRRKRMQAEKAIRDAYYRGMFHQFERTRLLMAVSPIADFEYLTEAVVSGGYPRFRKVWEDFHIYQGQFLAFFQALDARDPKSPHWFNPTEDVSTTRQPVAFETVPLFQEKPMTLSNRLLSSLKYLIISAVFIALIFSLSYVLFVRYDVR
jgi:ABC-type transport system involved in multi-copper enzyme maturation permease subunit